MPSLVYTRLDGGVSIVNIAPEMFDANSRTRQQFAANGVTFADDDEVIAFIAAKDVPKGLPYAIVSDVPEKDETRNTWRLVNGAIVTGARP